MTQTTARINQAGKHFEILVDMEKALDFKKGGSGLRNIHFSLREPLKKIIETGEELIFGSEFRKLEATLYVEDSK